MDTCDTALGMYDETSIPGKRDRTDSMNTLVQLPAPQRSKQEETSKLESFSQQSSGRLVMKDRKGTSGKVVKAHLMLNAANQVPPPKEKSNPRRWSKEEDESLRLAVERSGERNWKAIADQVPGRNHTQCLQRWTKVLKPGLIKGHWTSEEDDKLRKLVAEGKKNWGQVASLIPGRTSKQCRERWCNHLDPNINKGAYTEEEDKIIVEMQAKLGNRWSIIAQQLNGRTEDAVKIRWKSLMRSKRAALKSDIQCEFHGSKAGSVMAHNKTKGKSSKGMQNKSFTQPLNPGIQIFEKAQSRSQYSVEGSTNTLVMANKTHIINSVSNVLSEKRNISENQHLYSMKSESNLPLSDDFRSTYQTIAVGHNHTHSSYQGSTEMNSEASIPPDSIKPKLKRSLATAAKNALDEVVCVSEATIEEWGSSQTPQSQMVQSEGHASAFELFHQQRLRLILRERERALSVTSAPSPGQAMLTKELEENKARQNRQAIIQNGWRTAVEAMLSGNNESNDEEHFEDLMEKVNISSLHPSDDDLIDRSQPDIVVSTE